MRTLTIAGALIASALLTGAAATQSSRAGTDVEQRIDALLAKMTLPEKLGQLQQLDGEANGNARPEHAELAKAGRLGSTLNVRGAARVNALQRVAVEQSRLRVPLIFAFDVIHGYRTVFPIPLGEAASWDPAAVERAAAVAAAESRASGIHWTFAPMVDIARDARWGRVAEGSGEDPHLGAIMAAARVRGFQGDDYSRPDRIVACAKHWVAYGAAEGGRDYNTTDLSEHTLRTIYFPPFHAAVQAGAGTFMSAFNSLNGVPTSGNPWTLRQILRDEWKFDGMVVSDYNSISEMIAHGVAAGEADAARIGLTNGVDMEMVSRTIATHGEPLVREGKLPMSAVDEAVRRVLRIKMRAGLFERPYADEALERTTVLKPEFRQAAREVAARSMVLLKNDGGVLPLSTDVGRLAVIGMLANDRENMMGNWTGDGRASDVVTILEGIRQAVSPKTTVDYAAGVGISVERLRVETDQQRADDERGMDEAVKIATAADAILLVLGETGGMSGEASSRASIDLPGRQLALAERVIAATRGAKKPVAVVLLNGRPLAIPELAQQAPAILDAWFPGTEAGHAVADVLFGRVNPGGKLPVTFPRHVGQLPMSYNYLPTGRPPQASQKYTSKYLDVDVTPLFPFGHGLSYTTFALRDVRLSAPRIAADGTVRVSVDVENTGVRAGDEVVQVYVRDVVASVSRPVTELKAFSRVSLRPGQRQQVTFTLGPRELGFYNQRMQWVVEPGRFDVRVGTSAVGGLQASFEVQ